jgi:multidrug transporter EmrE-like cation transporter
MLSSILLIFYLFGAVALNSAGQTMLKLGSGQSLLNFYILGGLLTYGFGTICYILVLSKFNLSFAYPVVIGLTIIVTTMSGALLLAEKVSVTQWFGIGLVLSGILAISQGKP